MNYTSLLSPKANVNAMSKYAKFDLEPWYNFMNVNEEAGNSITASARQAKDKAVASIIILLYSN